MVMTRAPATIRAVTTLGTAITLVAATLVAITLEPITLAVTTLGAITLVPITRAMATLEGTTLAMAATSQGMTGACPGTANLVSALLPTPAPGWGISR